MAILKHYKTTDSPRGSFMIDPETHDIVQNIYIRRVEKRNGKPRQYRVPDLPEGQGYMEGDESAEAAIAESRIWALAGGGEPPAFAVSGSAARVRDSRP